MKLTSDCKCALCERGRSFDRLVARVRRHNKRDARTLIWLYNALMDAECERDMSDAYIDQLTSKDGLRKAVG